MGDQPKEELQAHAATPKPKIKGQNRGSPTSPPKMNPSHPMLRKVAKEEAKESEVSLSQDKRSGIVI